MSLRIRLALFLVVSIVTAVFAQSILGFLEFQRVIYKDLDGDLNQFLGSTASKLESVDDLKQLDVNYENYVTRSRILDGTTVMAELGGRFPKTNGLVTEQPQSYQSWRFASLALPGLGANIRLEGAINSGEYEKSLLSYRHTAMLTALVFSGVGIALALFLSAQALRPLNRLLETIFRVSKSGDLSLRVPAGGYRELVRLSQGFNAMLERLQTFRSRETEFTRHASHELRTPLTAITLEISSYHEGIISADEAIQAIEREAKRMKRLSEALLLLAREQTPEMHTLDLSALVKRCADRANLAFEQLIDLEVLGHEALIERALENLIENAEKYAPHLSISIQLNRDLQGHTLLSVTDQGQGMNQETLERATEIFYRASNTLERGSGVGLSVVKRIMDAHNGVVRFENVQPHGLRVTLEFPNQYG